MTAERILIVDDEPQVHRFLRPTLEAAGYAVESADSGAEALRLAGARGDPGAAPATRFALVLLDLGLPDIDGQLVLRRLLQAVKLPVIVLSARDQVAEKVAALDGGANDYLEKPFDVDELLARIRTALRLAAGHETQAAIYRHGVLEVDTTRRTVRVDGAAVEMTPREFELLALLTRDAGRVLTHRHLLERVWGPAHTDDVQYLRVYVGHIRQKLGPAGSLVLTVPGVGYRLADPAG